MGDRDHHKNRDDRPASTDIKDAHTFTDAEYEQYQKQQAAKAKQGEKHDIKARIVGRSTVDERLELLIGAGSDQGIHDGMEGSVVNQSGRALYDFRVFGTTGNTCKAYIATPHFSHDDIVANPRVVINPSKKH